LYKVKISKPFPLSKLRNEHNAIPPIWFRILVWSFNLCFSIMQVCCYMRCCNEATLWGNFESLIMFSIQNAIFHGEIYGVGEEGKSKCFWSIFWFVTLILGTSFWNKFTCTITCALNMKCWWRSCTCMSHLV
jgi:hypothetical protein